MTGRFEDSHAYLPFSIRLQAPSDIVIEFVVDTGFGGDLTLPVAAVASPGLPYSRTMEANLTDGSSVQLAVHTAAILWQGEEREVDVLATGRQPLVGMGLFAGSELVIQCRDGGIVTAEEL